MTFKPKMNKGIKKQNLVRKSGVGLFVPKPEKGSITVQFLAGPEEWEEYYSHNWEEMGKWNFVPCTGDEDCELCQSESEKVKRQNYTFAAHVINVKEKKVQILTGPQDLAARLFHRWEKSEESKPGMFVRRVWDLSRVEGKNGGYDVDRSELDPINPKTFPDLPDILKFLADKMEYFYGEGKKLNVKALDDDAVATTSWEDAVDNTEETFDSWGDPDPEDDFKEFAAEVEDEDGWPEPEEVEEPPVTPPAKKGRPARKAE